jgi:hypothetical protein
MKSILLSLLTGSLLLVMAAQIWGGEEPTQDVPKLEAGFASPPASARPWVFWFWGNGWLSREGITADLEAMRCAGIGGALIMETGQSYGGSGPYRFLSDEWREIWKHMLAEAARRGIEINMHQSPGWCGSGGPWITPEMAQQKVVWSELLIEGGKPFEGPLPTPKAWSSRKGPWYRDIAVIAFPTPQGDQRIANLARKTLDNSSRYSTGYVAPQANYATTAPQSTIGRQQVLTLTDRCDKQGRLAWDVPAGSWTVMRFAYTPVGLGPTPVPKGGDGLDCDKLSKEALDVHWAAMMGKLVADAGPHVGKTLVATHIDSWETGGQNWTARMPEEFRKRRGYDIVPLLPIVAGRIVESLEFSERFLWDLRQTISEMAVEYYAGHMRERARQNGLRLSIEAYEGPMDDMAFGSQADEPMCEFWGWTGRGSGGRGPRSQAAAAHVYGKTIVGAESFTSEGGPGLWSVHPAMLKPRGDDAFCEGVNRIVFHRYSLCPWVNTPPMRPGPFPYGIYHDRCQTWWDLSRAYHDYLARCQYLLRQGLFVADILRLLPEAAPGFPPGAYTGVTYDYDCCSADVLLRRAAVRDGRIVLPDGMSYQVLALPAVETMTPALLRKIAELLETGATVVGNPPLKAPGLADSSRNDAEVARLVKELWGDGAEAKDRKVKDRKVGRGRLFWGVSPEAALTELRVPLDFRAIEGTARYIHRRDGETDIYFVASGSSVATRRTCVFRVAGKQPELWRPDTGRIDIPAVYRIEDGCTTIPIDFDPDGSVFVVFRRPAATDPVVKVSRGDTVLLGVAESQTPRPAPVPKAPSATGPKIADAPPVVHVSVTDGRVRVVATEAGAYVLKTASGRECTAEVGPLPPAVEPEGPWKVRFAKGWGAPEEIALDKLISWHEHADAGVKYFSGTASYATTLSVPRDLLKPGRRFFLDLGRVAVIAQATLNGKDLGILWKSPHRVEVTDALMAGKNVLEIQVVNTWHNRLVGDAQLPPDALPRPLPKWLTQGGGPSPNGRYTAFVSFERKGPPEPEPAGLLGPVRLEPAAEVFVHPIDAGGKKGE